MTKFAPPLPATLRNLSLSVCFLAFGQVACAQQTPLPDSAEEAVSDTIDVETVEEITTPTVQFATTEAPDDHVIGSETAPITVVMYASVTCSHCGAWFQTQWDSVKSNLIEKDKIRFILRAVPTAPQQMSVLGFLMSECAPDSAYFETIEYQMNNQKAMFDLAREGKGKEAYAPVAKLAGLMDDEAIKTCLEDPKMMDHLRLSGERSDAAKITGVPAFYVNGEAYNGKQDADTLIALFDEMIDAGISALPEVEPYDPHAGHGH